MPNDNDILDLDFDLPPLRKLSKPGEPPAPAAAPALPKTPPKRTNLDDILSAPDADEKGNFYAAAAAAAAAESADTSAYSSTAEDKLASAQYSGYSSDQTSGASGIEAQDTAGGTDYDESASAQTYYEEPASEPVPTSDPTAGQYAAETAAEEQYYSADDPAEQAAVSPIPPQTAREISSSPAPEGSVRKNFDIFSDGSDDDLPPAANKKTESSPEEKSIKTPPKDPLDDALPPPAPKKSQKEEFVGSYEQKNRGNFVIGDDDDDDDDLNSSYDSDLSSIDKNAITLEEMDKSPKTSKAGREAAKALRQQVLFDDISMDIDKMPVLEDLSSEYTTMKEKIRNDDIVMKAGKLGDNERRAIKDHLREEINRRPENFNKHASMAMANHLAEERKIKKAKKGFLLTIPVVFMALGSAAATFFGIGGSELEYAMLFKYISVGTVVFALMLLIKSRHLKTLSAIYFILNTLALLGPGLIMHVLGQRDTDPDFNLHIVFYLGAAILSGVAAFMLCTSDLIHAYYTTDTGGRRR